MPARAPADGEAFAPDPAASAAPIAQMRSTLLAVGWAAVVHVTDNISAFPTDVYSALNTTRSWLDQIAAVVPGANGLPAVRQRQADARTARRLLIPNTNTRWNRTLPAAAALNGCIDEPARTEEGAAAVSSHRPLAPSPLGTVRFIEPAN